MRIPCWCGKTSWENIYIISKINGEIQELRSLLDNLQTYSGICRLNLRDFCVFLASMLRILKLNNKGCN